ncbi:UNVERIFIED_CONTAM: hypothetical protein FKN15_038634 [Acipenser sinensis]
MDLGLVVVLGLATLAMAVTGMALFVATAAGLFSAVFPSADYAVAAEDRQHHVLVLPLGLDGEAAGTFEWCWDCPGNQWSLQGSASCWEKSYFYLYWSEPIGITLIILSLTGAALTLAVFILYLKHWETPIVKTAGGSIFYSSVAGLFCSFLTFEWCWDCPGNQWSLQGSASCWEKSYFYLYWSEPIGITLIILSLTGAALTLAVFILYLKHWETPIVKTAGGSIFYSSVAGLFGSFLSVPFYLGEPLYWKCQTRLVLFTLSFSLCLSSILAKTVRILCAFASSTGRPTKLQTRLHLIILVLGPLVQCLACLLWLVLIPPQSRYVFPEVETHIKIECYHSSRVPTFCVMGYLCCLALCTLLAALKGNSLPSNFNDSQGISLSTMAFYAVWLSTIPTLQMDEGKRSAIVLSMAILLSSFSSLGFLFLQKCYIILRCPEKNTPEWVKQSNYEYCQKIARKTNLSVKMDTCASVTSSVQ